MQKLTITRIFKAKNKKDGTPYPYPRCSIQASEYGNMWISGKWNEVTDKWKEGDVVEADVQLKLLKNKIRSSNFELTIKK